MHRGMGNECRVVEECGRMAPCGEEPERKDNEECGGLMGVKADKLKLSLCPSPDLITIIREKSGRGDPALSPSIRFLVFK